LQEEVAAMNVDNFVVRAKRKLVEKFAKPEAWTRLSGEDFNALGHEIAGLPTELPAENEEAKRFDLLILNLQLAILNAEPSFTRLQRQVVTIAGLLEEQSTIPMINKQLALIQDIQSDGWWEDMTTPMLEIVRRRIRDLVKLIEKKKRKPVYTDFEDQMGEQTDVELPGVTTSDETFAAFRRKARVFLRQQEDHESLNKLRNNIPLQSQDISELERLLVENGIGTEEYIEQAKQNNEGLGLFIRSLVGLNRQAAKDAMNKFLNGKTWTANQIEFINLIVNHLTENGTMDPAMLYESPFTDVTPLGPDGIFTSAQIDELLAILIAVRNAALAA
jgi:type I restriction enzyme R subunit